MPTADIIAVTRIQARRTVVPDREHSETVMLDLKKPRLTVEGRWDAFDDLKREFTRSEHDSYLKKYHPALKGLLMQSRADSRAA